MPVAPTWCQGPAVRILKGSEGPATFFFLEDPLALRPRRCTAQGPAASYRAEIYPRRSWGTCRRAISSITRTRLLPSGVVEENPGPSLRGMQWNSAGLIQAERLAHHKTLVEENVTFCLLSEKKLSCAEVSSFTIAGYQHHGVSHPSKGGGVSILAREDLPVEVGLTVVASIEYAHATIHMSEGLALTVTSAYSSLRGDHAQLQN
ncbi:Tbingi protein [Trypanosoma theileri]|uniref:Tbingi protein n=1 Tax=Trypanosoma theileri TaxID=67003 RepID=A0A1X0NL35_9TRYP|nr:Tbingi protein [Trypanosoma theileri]ORC85238.1 Tbingi protein [Trypanosoma theileri]